MYIDGWGYIGGKTYIKLTPRPRRKYLVRWSLAIAVIWTLVAFQFGAYYNAMRQIDAVIMGLPLDTSISRVDNGGWE